MTRYNFKSLYSTTIKSRHLLNKKGSSKSTYQIILDLQGSGIQFRPGDSLGVIPENDPEIVDACLKYMNIEDLSQKISEKGQTLPLKEYLTKKANITKVKPSLLRLLLKNAHTHASKEKLTSILENPLALQHYIENHELWDTLKEFNDGNTPYLDICSCLLPLLPRLYSISSAYCAFPNEAHLTVAYLQYETSGIKRHGVASYYLCRLADKIDVYLHSGAKFCLPIDSHIPVIMIAAGTGIAPFVSFLQERYFYKVKSKNWLFFGECHRAFDFYYEDLWEKLEKENFLKVTTAFSRDQEQKIYVQHRIIENKDKLWRWIEEGASIYICGDAKAMAKEVDLAFLTIFKEAGNMSDTKAKEYLHLLILNKRYLKDVY